MPKRETIQTLRDYQVSARKLLAEGITYAGIAQRLGVTEAEARELTDQKAYLAEMKRECVAELQKRQIAPGPSVDEMLREYRKNRAKAQK